MLHFTSPFWCGWIPFFPFHFQLGIFSIHVSKVHFSSLEEEICDNFISYHYTIMYENVTLFYDSYHFSPELFDQMTLSSTAFVLTWKSHRKFLTKIMCTTEVVNKCGNFICQTRIFHVAGWRPLHEKLKHKQKLHRFKQVNGVQWLK